jgi:GR25 family glycosyltransferase involved in LPS biosynthesis
MSEVTAPHVDANAGRRCRGTHTACGINEVYPYKVCINLDRRRARWQQMQLKFERSGIHSVDRFSGFDGENLQLPANWAHTPGAYGCLLSHLQVVREARRLGVASVLIFEDDVVLDDDFERKFNACLGELPPDWDMLFFGALHKDEPIKVSRNIARITQANSTYACALKATVFDDFIELNSNTDEVLDNNSLILQRRYNSYCFMPHLAWVEADHSDAQRRWVDHWYLRESLVLFGPEVDRLLSGTTIVFAHGDRIGDGGAPDNLLYLVHYYHRYFGPLMHMVIVDQGGAPTIDPSTLPSNCKYLFRRDEGPFDRERCFLDGIAQAEARNVFILCDSDIYLETLDVRANLRMCERYDCVTGFSRIVELTATDSVRLRNARTTQGIDIMTQASPGTGGEGYCRFLTGAAIRMLLAGAEDEAVGSLLSPRAKQIRVFQSPNYALRLQPARTRW